MRLARGGPVGLLGYICACACGGSGDSSTEESAGVGGAGSSSTICQATCERKAEAGCPESPSTEACLAECEELRRSCGAELDAAFRCLEEKGTYSCSSSGNVAVSGCELESVPAVRCAFCTPLESDDACDRCAATECCDETRAYLDHPDYPSVISCVLGCDTTECTGDCYGAYPEVAELAEAFAACRVQCGVCE